ncbi:putative integral membrane protein [Paenibacillus sp. JCM 10914]|nr:M50 family metallopeptidase [Paenibacillus sp. JCM 10914]GAE09320.1 putative integral membrane protein [Paenibacillus sp. JCM 10914]
MTITVLALLMIVFFVQSGYGVWWLIIFIIVNLIFYFIGGKIRNFYYLLLAFLVLEESVVGPLSLLIMAFTQPKQAGDASNLANMTVLPAFVWALLFFLFSLWCAKVALQLFWKKR